MNIKTAGNIPQVVCVLLDQLRQQVTWGDTVLEAINGTNED
jgi:hypothetical protein